jgi:uncharacterized protein (DUF2252 family)
VAGYRAATADLAAMGSLDVFYAKNDADQGKSLTDDAAVRKAAKRVVSKARRRTSTQAMAKLTVTDDEGRPRIVEQPPLIVRPPEPDDQGEIVAFVEEYRASVRADVRRLLSHFEIVDVSRKVVGVGSVGTRCYVALLLDDHDAPLFLQVKEAESSVLAKYWPAAETLEPGRRVVEGQQIMQAASDVFLGWGSTPGGTHSYVRQLRDMKGSAELDHATPTTLAEYTALCGRVLARAHAQSGKAAAIADYLGSSTRFDDAVADFALAYATQTDQDHAELLAAIEGGRIEAFRGV